MKKILFVLMILASGTSYSQSIILSSPTTISNGLITPPNTVVNNDTIVYCVSDMVTLFEDGKVIVINNTASTMPVKVKRFGGSDGCFLSNQFCWTLCYDPDTSVSPDPTNIAAYDSSTIFHGWVLPDETDGCCFIKYRFFNANDTNVYSDVTIKYCFSANCSSPTLGIDDASFSDYNVYPNPATEFLKIDFDPSSSPDLITIADLSGKIVFTSNITPNMSNVTIPLETIANGVYLCRLMRGGNIVYSNKLIVSR